MKKLIVVLFVVSFSIPAMAQFAGVRDDHRAANYKPAVRTENIEVTPTIGIQPGGVNSDIIITFTYIDGALQKVTANSPDTKIQCEDPEKDKILYGYYRVIWCTADRYNLIYGCDKEWSNYVSAKAPK